MGNRFIYTLIFIGFQILCFGQTPKTRPTVASINQQNEVVANKDSVVTVTQIKYSKDSLDAPVVYDAHDSIYYDVKKNLMYLYDKASMKYKKVNLTANYITINGKESIAHAEVGKDSLGKPKGKPQFDDGGDQKLEATKLTYNIKTRKGIVFETQTKQQNMFVTGYKTKFVGKDPKDSTTNDVIFQKDAIVSTCDAPSPHYGLKATKLKMVANKWLIMGPANLQIAGVPTPVWLPFAAFPLKKGSHSGIIFPSNYTSDPIRGFGLLGVGYYYPVNQHWDATIKADLFLRGSWGVEVDSRYNYIYKNSGDLNVSYKVLRTEFEDTKARKLTYVNTPTFSIRWTHRNDARANPNQTFGGSINITTNSDRRRYNNDFKSVSQNQFGSGIQYTRKFPQYPNLNLQASMSHNQNTQTKQINVTLPDLALNVSSFAIFKNNKRIGEEKWYERINFGMNINAQNSFSGRDSTFFTRATLKSANVGLKYNANMSTNLKLFKYIDINPNVTFSSLHYLKSIEKNFTPTTVYDSLRKVGVYNALTLKYDSSYQVKRYGTVDTTLTWDKLYSIPSFNAGVTATTNLFGILRLKSGKNKLAIRHKLTPSVSYNLTPSLYRDAWYRYVQTTSNPNIKTFEQRFQRYSIFEGAVYGSPSYQDPKNRKGNQSIGYSLTQLFETKYRFRKDTIDKKGQILENIFATGNYNPLADSLKFDDLRWNTNRSFFNGHTSVNVGGTMSFYALKQDTLGKYYPVNQFYANSERKNKDQYWYLKPLRHQALDVNISSAITVKEIRELFKPKNNQIDNSTSIGKRSSNSPQNVTQIVKTGENFLDLFNNFSINHNFGFMYGKRSGTIKDTLVVGNHSVGLRGTLQLTKHWNVSINNIGYNFIQKELTYPDFSIGRDLHCFDMLFSYQPIRGSYTFLIRVKQAPMDFLKLPFNKQSPDAFRGF